MSRFLHLNNNINNILSAILENQNLCKLIKYNTNDPFSEPDLPDTSDLLSKKIFPLPKLPKPDTEMGNYLNIFFDHFKLPHNTGVKEGVVLFNIICHLDLWIMEGAGLIRPFSILHEIDEMFNNQRVAGIKRMQFVHGKFLYVNENYSGYQAGYQIVSGN